MPATNISVMLITIILAHTLRDYIGYIVKHNKAFVRVHYILQFCGYENFSKKSILVIKLGKKHYYMIIKFAVDCHISCDSSWFSWLPTLMLYIGFMCLCCRESEAYENESEIKGLIIYYVSFKRTVSWLCTLTTKSYNLCFWIVI